MIVPAYEEAEKGNYSKIKELQTIFNNPYEEQSLEIEQKYDRLKPSQFFNNGGISHYSCSSWNHPIQLSKWVRGLNKEFYLLIVVGTPTTEITPTWRIAGFFPILWT